MCKDLERAKSYAFKLSKEEQGILADALIEQISRQSTTETGYVVVQHQDPNNWQDVLYACWYGGDDIDPTESRLSYSKDIDQAERFDTEAAATDFAHRFCTVDIYTSVDAIQFPKYTPESAVVQQPQSTEPLPRAYFPGGYGQPLFAYGCNAVQPDISRPARGITYGLICMAALACFFLLIAAVAGQGCARKAEPYITHATQEASK